MMHSLRRLVARIRYRHFDDELRRELAEHRTMLEEEARARGASAAEARYEAARALGNTTLAREASRGVWIAPWLEGLWQDVRYAARSLRTSPSFTLPALAVLILTMGLTTGLYATIESVMLRPWPVHDPHRVMVVHLSRGALHATVGPVQYDYFQEHARSIDLIAHEGTSVRIGPGAESSHVRLSLVSGNYFDALRLPIAAGRALVQSDDARGPASAVAVISHDFWQRQFGGKSEAVGSVMQVDDLPVTVVGVTAEGARDRQASSPDMWMPLRARFTLSPGLVSYMRLEEPDGWGAELAGRLRPGADTRTVEAELNSVAARFAALHDVPPLTVSVTSTARINHIAARESNRMLSLLSIAVIMMLLLGCANVGNLQLARTLSRGGELAVRRALGAPRERLVRHSLVESLLLCLVAGGLSLVLAIVVLPQLLQRVWPAQAGVAEVGWRAMLFASGLAMVVCLLAGLLPALSTTRMTGSQRYAPTGTLRLRASLLAFQLAVSVILLTGAGLLVRSIHHAAGPGLGFDLAGTAAVAINPPDTFTPADRERLGRAVIEASRDLGLPVAAARSAPYGGGYYPAMVERPHEEAVANAPVAGQPTRHDVSPEYFHVLQIPLKAGRLFDARSPPEDVLVNETLARLLWPGRTAVGEVFVDRAFDRDGPRMLGVIGVVGDARTEFVYQQNPIYYTFRPAGFSFMLVRDEAGAAVRLRDLIQALEPSAAAEIRHFDAAIWEQLGPAMTVAAGGVAVSLLALLIAAVGTLGVFSYVVNERTREIGVRMALGARARDIVRMLVARLSWPLAGGLAVGLLGAQALGGVLGNRLYGLSPRDPIACLTVLVILLVAATVAIWLPARRAVHVDPAVTLRAE